MEHPSGLIKKKLHMVYLKALGLAHNKIERITLPALTLTA
jgi:hypothetical protein